MIKGILAIIFGYLLGSISPAYFLTKLLKGKDIRELGDGNAGTRNVYHNVGLIPAVITGLFDISKGVVAILISSLFVPLFFSYFAGLMAVIGHIFPFYLKFRGGQGGATLSGILLFFIFQFLFRGWLSWLLFLVLLIVGLIFIYITKLGPLAGLIVLPFLIFGLFIEAPFNLTVAYIIFLLIITLVQLIRYFFIQGKKRQWFFEKELSKKEKKEILRWRTLMRPLGILIIIFYLLFGKLFILIVIGAVTLFFILIDISRLSFKNFNFFLLKNLFIKQKEMKIFSSMSLFCLASFIILLIFERKIAFVALLFLIFGDFFAKIIGILYGRRKFFTKTLEGTLAYFASCLLFGFFTTYFWPISFLTVFCGALTASLIEVLPIGIDDNFTIGLISASVMYLINLI